MTPIHDTQHSWREKEVGPQMTLNNNNTINNKRLLSTYYVPASQLRHLKCIISFNPLNNYVK